MTANVSVDDETLSKKAYIDQSYYKWGKDGINTSLKPLTVEALNIMLNKRQDVFEFYHPNDVMLNKKGNQS